jgi:hypothetical protein
MHHTRTHSSQFHFKTYNSIIQDTLQLCTTLQKKGHTIVAVQLDTYVSNMVKLVQSVARFATRKGGRPPMHSRRRRQTRVRAQPRYREACRRLQKQEGGTLNLNDFETTARLVWYRKRQHDEPVQPPIQAETFREGFLHVTLQTQKVTAFLNELRQKNANILSINYDTYMDGTQNVVMQAMEKEGGLETTVAAVFYTLEPSPVAIRSLPSSSSLAAPSPLTYEWETYTFSSYPTLIDSVLARCGVLQTHGYTIYNIQLDTYMPVFGIGSRSNSSIGKANETNALIWYAARGQGEEKQSTLSVREYFSRLKGHRGLMKDAAKFLTTLPPNRLLNVNVDTFTPFSFCKAFQKIMPEQTHMCVFYV